MTDFSDLKEHVKKLLPTPAMQFATIATLGIAISSASLPAYLKEVWPELRIPEVLLFQAALISTILFFGSFILVILLISHIKNLENIKSNSLPSNDNNEFLKWDESTGTWLDSKSKLRYCSKCKTNNISSPLKNNIYSWSCPSCNELYSDPLRQKPVGIQPYGGGPL